MGLDELFRGLSLGLVRVLRSSGPELLAADGLEDRGGRGTSTTEVDQLQVVSLGGFARSGTW